MVARMITRVPMPIRKRAKQFAMFDAMKGLTEAIAEKERQFCSKRELSEDRMQEISRSLSELQLGDIVTVIYYCQYGKYYRKLTGTVSIIDYFGKEICVNDIFLGFGEIYDISTMNKSCNES